jgi:glycosyltransferase involved in cell wall biosynthesis
MRAFVFWLLRAADNAGSTGFVFENTADPIKIGFAMGRPNNGLTLMGAGIDPSIFAPQPMPVLPILKLALVSRMIWSKGVDLAVAAVSRMIDRGAPIELDLYGEPDYANQRYFPVEVLQEWGCRPGIRWHGFVRDVVAVWREHHAALCPSRGGEGLPRVILEAAACSRPIIAANVPGCSDFVRPNLEGIVFEPNSVQALEWALDTALQQFGFLDQMGRAARQRLLQSATEEIISAQYRSFFISLARLHCRSGECF